MIEIKVSSTKIRNAINNGDVHLVPEFSGYHFEFTGMVIKGQGIGQKLNYPTANIHIENENKIIPNNGVYAVKCNLKMELQKE